MNYELIREDLKRHEGDREFPYDDKTGKDLKPGDTLVGLITTGFGWNLSHRPLPEKIRLELLEIAIGDALIDCNKLYPDFQLLPDQIQRVLVNMAYNMGYRRLSGFSKMNKAVAAQDWPEMIAQMVDSNWYHQVGGRAKELEAIVRNV